MEPRNDVMLRNATVELVSTSGSPAAATCKEATAEATRRKSECWEKSARRIAFQRMGTQFSPAAGLAWILGLMGVSACIAPWLAHGWMWIVLIDASGALVICYDALTLWLARGELEPVLLRPEKGLRGQEGRSIQIALALTGVGKLRLHGEVAVAIMPATRASEIAIRVNGASQKLKLERPSETGQSCPAAGDSILLWPWTAEVALLRRGLWPGPRVGIERRSRLGGWRMRKWFDCGEQLRIEPDLRAARREVLRSPVYRALVASRQTPWTGLGRDFERLREYQPGDNYSEIAWKSTARRGVPVTRLFQWEQKQEVYFLVDQSRLSAIALDLTAADTEGNAPQRRSPRRLLDLAVETALAGASVALELGDEFGLVTYADEPKSWLRAGGGQFQFHQFRDRLLNLEPLPTTADYEALFGEIRLRLRRRAYLVLLADVAERSVADSLSSGVGLVRSSHVVLVTSVLPAHARPAFSPGAEPQTNAEVYGALAAEKENQRLGALSRQLRHMDVQLRFVAPEAFLRTAVEGYLQGKREQRL